jgi:PIN domain nuclease of toxin-antitoxin system
MDEIIIDTIVLDYLTRNQKAITPTAMIRIQQADVVYVSVSSIWELANHVRAKLIPINIDFDTFYQETLQKLGLTLLDTQWEALKYFSTFDYLTYNKQFTRNISGSIVIGTKQELHKDPFDRMIIAHAISMNLPLVSPDSLFPHYAQMGLKLIW